MEDQQIKSFCDNYSSKSLIRQRACFRSPANPIDIDLILPNTTQSFQYTCVLEKGLSDLHLKTLIVMGKVLKKSKPRSIKYRSYKHFSNEVLRKGLLNKLSKDM